VKSSDCKVCGYCSYINDKIAELSPKSVGRPICQISRGLVFISVYEKWSIESAVGLEDRRAVRVTNQRAPIIQVNCRCNDIGSWWEIYQRRGGA